LPATFKQGLQRVLGALHAQVVEQLRGFKRFVLRIEADAELLEDILVGANQHELSTLPIEELWRIDRDEPAAVESLAQRLWQIGSILFLQTDAGRSIHVWILHGDDVAAFSRDVQLLLHFAAPLREFERKRQMRVVVVTSDRVDPLTRGSCW
jgi:hypothetical protein